LILLFAAAVALLLATGCDRNDLLKFAGYDRVSLMRRNTPQREEGVARHCAELLREGRYDDVIEMLQPDLATAESSRQTLTAIHDILAERSPVSLKVIDAQTFRDGDARITNIVLEYEFPPAPKATGGSTEFLPAEWAFVMFSIRGADNAPDKVSAINLVPSAQPIEAINAFTFENKGASQYAALAIGMLLLAFTIYAALVCIRANIGKQKWLWLLLMLFTIYPVSVNWNTGHWSFDKISFGFAVPPVPANLTCSAYGPWNLALGLPVGAVAFVIYRRCRCGSTRKTTAVETSVS